MLNIPPPTLIQSLGSMICMQISASGVTFIRIDEKPQTLLSTQPFATVYLQFDNKVIFST